MVDPPLTSIEAGPKPTTSLSSRDSSLSSATEQLARLSSLDLKHLPHKAAFDVAVGAAGWNPLRPGPLDIFQINLGKLCNMTCRHCHVDAGPDRVQENMGGEIVDSCLDALDKTDAATVDITGGAPELNPHFSRLVDACVRRGKHVMDRCNLTILLLPRFRDLPAWLAERHVEVVCSLPHYRKLNTDSQRGDGTFAKSVEALRRLNAAGYGHGRPGLTLTLVSNPAGAYLAGNQAEMEREWKRALAENHGIVFDRLIVINNMPISRFLEWLEASGNLRGYLELLVNSFNPATIGGVMCRNTISIGWDGRIYDCDFNQMLELQARYQDGTPVTVHNFEGQLFSRRTILTARHCYGCAAGSGSSCGGSITK